MNGRWDRGLARHALLGAALLALAGCGSGSSAKDAGRDTRVTEMDAGTDGPAAKDGADGGTAGDGPRPVDASADGDASAAVDTSTNADMSTGGDASAAADASTAGDASADGGPGDAEPNPIMEFSLPAGVTEPNSIAAGPDGNIWFTF